MKALKFLARSPIAWLTIALGALFVAPTAAFAQDITVLTPANPSANGQIVGNKGIASHVYQIDYVAGTFVDVRMTPRDRAQWWPLTVNRQARSRGGGLWAEVWGPNGRIDRADFRKSRSSSCTLHQARTDGSCIGFSASGADVIEAINGPFMIKVNATAPISMPYTIEARRLGAPRATNAGAAPGGDGPMLSNRNAQIGTLTGKSGSQGGASAYFTFMHPGGGKNVGNPAGAGSEILLTYLAEPHLSPAQTSNVGLNIYQGTKLVRALGPVGTAGDTTGTDSSRLDSLGKTVAVGLKYNSENAELLTVEVYNYNPGVTITYVVHEG